MQKKQSTKKGGLAKPRGQAAKEVRVNDNDDNNNIIIIIIIFNISRRWLFL